jgi:hypothetical protein
MAKQIESIEIFPGENGGHRVVHNFKREPSKKEGAMVRRRRDQMPEIISPSDGDQAPQLQGMQAQLQQQQAAMAEMQGQFQRLLLEKQGKVIDNEYALKLKEMDIQAKLAVAEIETKAQKLSERLAFVEEFMKQQHAQAHAAGMQAQDHAHERALAQQQDAEAMSQASDQAHQVGMVQVQQPQEGE